MNQEDGGNMFLQNTDVKLQSYSVSKLRPSLKHFTFVNFSPMKWNRQPFFALFYPESEYVLLLKHYITGEHLQLAGYLMSFN